VGLPLSLVLGQAGLRVGIYDTDAKTIERIARGEMPFMEKGAEPLLAQLLSAGCLELGSDASIIGRADTVIVVIGTPVDEFLRPSMSVFERAVDQLAPHLRADALVVLRSTVYPGTTEYVATMGRTRRSGNTAGAALPLQLHTAGPHKGGRRVILSPSCPRGLRRPQPQAVHPSGHAVGDPMLASRSCHVGDKTPKRPPKSRKPKPPKRPVA
jgi:UDP-glucose 6-dehydrogenase